MASFPRTVLPVEVTSLEMPGPLISKAQSGKVHLRTTQQVGRSWTERFLINTRSVDGRALLAAVDDYWRNGTIFTIDHRDHLTPLGTGGGSPLINQSPQLVTDPENFAAWTTSGTIVVTGGQTDPFGGTAAFLIDSNATSNDTIQRNVTFTADATKCMALWMRAGTAGKTRMRLIDVTTATNRQVIDVTWTAGVPSPAVIVGAGTLFTTLVGDGGWYRIETAVAGVIAANTNRFEIYADQNGTLGTTYIYGANAWNTPTPAGHIGPSHPTATGNRLYIDGATASVTNWLRAGDIVTVAGLGPVYEVPSNTNSQAGGYVSLPVNPPIFTGGAPADNAVVTITGVTMNACIIEPPTFPTTSGSSNDYGELRVSFSESL